MTEKLLRAAAVLLAGAAGGVLFQFLHVPLPWTLGSLFASAAIAIGWPTWQVPAFVRDLARPTVGVLAGAGFTPAIVQAIPEWWAEILLTAAYTIVIASGGVLLFTHLCGMDRATAFLAALPGGLSEMVLQSTNTCADTKAVATIHIVRIIALVLTIPLVLQIALGHPIVRTGLTSGAATIGGVDWGVLIACGVCAYLLATYVRFPGGTLVAAMLCSAVVHGMGFTEASLPSWLVAMVQVVIGCVVGGRLAGFRVGDLGITVAIALGWAFILLVSTTALAWGAARFYGSPFETLLLAIAPGGTSEMIIISYALGAEVALVATCQVCRIFLIFAIGSWFLGRLKPMPTAPAPTSVSPPRDPRE